MAWEALDLAINKQWTALLALLRGPEGGTKAREKDDNGDLPLHYAAGKAPLEVIQALLDAHPWAVRERGWQSRTPLECAQRNNAPSGVVPLLERYTNMTDEELRQQTPEGRARREREERERSLGRLEEELRTVPGRARARGADGKLPLHAALERGGSCDLVRMLLDRGADPNAPDQEGGPAPLALACARADGREIAALLLDRGADLHHAEGEALRAACRNGSTDVARMLLERGANPNAGDALGDACDAGHAEVAVLLVHRGADGRAGARGQLTHDATLTTALREADQDSNRLAALLVSGDRESARELVQRGVRPAEVFMASLTNDRASNVLRGLRAEVQADRLRRDAQRASEEDGSRRAELAAAEQAHAAAEPARAACMEAHGDARIAEEDAERALEEAKTRFEEARRRREAAQRALEEAEQVVAPAAARFKGAQLAVEVTAAWLNRAQERSEEASAATGAMVDDAAVQRFEYGDLHRATNGFANDVLLGAGGFGSVYAASPMPGVGGGADLAVKRIRDAEQFTAELNVLTSFRARHPHVLPLLGFTMRDRDYFLVLPRMANGSLDLALPNLNVHTRVRAVAETASALEYLHNPSLGRDVVLHLDVKPANILLDADYRVKLGDYGLSRSMGASASHFSMTHVGGTPGYIDPEIMQQDRRGLAEGPLRARVGPQSDAYSLGVVVLHVLTGEPALDLAIMRSLAREAQMDASQLTPDEVAGSWPARTVEALREVGRGLTAPSTSRMGVADARERLDGVLGAEDATATSNEERGARVCMICMDAPRAVRFNPCGHAVACADCAAILRAGVDIVKCPYCRNVIEGPESDVALRRPDEPTF